MTCQETDKHGQRVERRTVWISGELSGWRQWPGLKTACMIRREVWGRIKPDDYSVEEDYAICSLPCSAELAPLVMTWWREHWHVENRLHYVRDVTMGEDASRIRSDSAPQILAAIRNAALALLRSGGWSNIAAALRHHAAKPLKALALIGIT